MDAMLDKVLEEESAKLGMPADILRELANKGCQIAFNDDLNSRIKRFGGLEYFTEDSLREFILVLADGATADIENELDSSISEK